MIKQFKNNLKLKYYLVKLLKVNKLIINKNFNKVLKF